MKFIDEYCQVYRDLIPRSEKLRIFIVLSLFSLFFQKHTIHWNEGYKLLGRVARCQSDFYATQSDFYHRFDQIDERQAKITEILNRYLLPESLS